MTPPGALALTGAALIVTALVLAAATDITHSHKLGRRYASVGWVVLAAGLADLIGSAWWEALS